MGAQRVSIPVIFAVATTMAAFSPLIFVPGQAGKFLGQMPTVVIILLMLSLIEAMLILPHHLSKQKFGQSLDVSSNPILIRLERIQRKFSSKLVSFINGPLHRYLILITSNPWTVLSSGFAMIIVSFGLVSYGYIKIQFFPIVEGKYVTATLELEPGTPIERTHEMAQEILKAGLNVEKQYQQEYNINNSRIVTANYLLVGSQDFAAPPFGAVSIFPDSNKASVVLELIKPEDRLFSAQQFEDSWRKRVGLPPGVTRLYFSSQLFNLGEPVQVELSSENEEDLIEAVDILENELNKINGVFDVRNDKDKGKREIKVELKPQARIYGLTLDGLANQLRGAFFGVEALRVQRGKEEIRVYVRLPESERDSMLDLTNYRIHLPGGKFVPLGAVANLSEGESPSTIRRRNGKRIVSVTANVDNTSITGEDVSNKINAETLPALSRKFPGLEYDFGGEQREQRRTLPALGRNFIFALFAIYALLAIAFGSYIQPLIIMAAIPFGAIGAIIGHLIMGINLTLPGMFGIVGLSGVIVNGALVMIDFINEEKRRGKPAIEAIIDGTKSRFRPILLTALTTFLGVFPLIIERSIQAQFLIPVACSIGFGVLFGTAVQILIVPALATIESNFNLKKN